MLLITFLLSYFIFHVCYVRALVETLSKMLSSFSNINALPVPMLRQFFLDSNPMHRHRTSSLFHENKDFWTSIRCTGIAYRNFFRKIGVSGPESDAQASHIVILVLNPMHRHRIS